MFFSNRGRIFLSLVCSHLFLAGVSSPQAAAELITFEFEAELVELPGPGYSLPLGQRAFGSYTFELNTAPLSFSTPNTSTFYLDAITNFTVTLEGIGTGSGGVDGDIFIGDPVQTTGSFNFLSDRYEARALNVTGLSMASPVGIRNLLNASIVLQDLDLQGLASEDLLATPPNLIPFLDNTGSTPDSDYAELWLTFDLPSGGGNTMSMQLTSLTAQASSIPEPGTFLALAAASGLLACRHRRNRRILTDDSDSNQRMCASA